MVLGQPRLRVVGLGLDHERAVGGADWRGSDAPPNGPLELGAELLPARIGARRVQRHLARARRRRIAVEGHAGAVGTPVRELREHRRQVRAELFAQRRRFCEKPSYATHAPQVRHSIRGAPMAFARTLSPANVVGSGYSLRRLGPGDVRRGARRRGASEPGARRAAPRAGRPGRSASARRDRSGCRPVTPASIWAAWCSKRTARDHAERLAERVGGPAFQAPDAGHGVDPIERRRDRHAVGQRVEADQVDQRDDRLVLEVQAARRALRRGRSRAGRGNPARPGSRVAVRAISRMNWGWLRASRM